MPIPSAHVVGAPTGRSRSRESIVVVSATDRTWFIYLVECADGTLYTGITVDPPRRVKQHNAGHGARYTRARSPVHLLGSVVAGSRVDALRLEKRVKRMRPMRKRAFFQENVEGTGKGPEGGGEDSSPHSK